MKPRRRDRVSAGIRYVVEFSSNLRDWNWNAVGTEVLAEPVSEEFQDDVWRKFCKENDIGCGEDEWYFPKGTTFVGWYEILRSSEEGRAYLRVYQGEED